jgi:hypothetical protein
MTKKQILRAAIFAMAVANVTTIGGGAFAAMPADFDWQQVIMSAGAKHHGVTMEDATAYSTREKQFAGFAPWIAENMKILDKNHDGMVDMDEMHAYMTEHHMTNADLYKVWYRQ